MKTCVYAIKVIQKNFVGRGTDNVPHKNTIRGIGNDNTFREVIVFKNTKK